MSGAKVEQDRDQYFMSKIRTSVLSVMSLLCLVPMLAAQDLSKYRTFQLSAKLPAIAKQLGMKTTDARTTHQRPALIQELEWQALYRDSRLPADSVQSILFSFYNGELFRLVVTYNRERTEGLLAADIIQALSAQYGVASKPDAELILASTYIPSEGEKIISERREKVIARWANDQYSYDLIQLDSTAPFGLVIYAKQLDALARTAIGEAIQLDQNEAPQRESERQKKKAAADRAKQATARQANKVPFRP